MSSLLKSSRVSPTRNLSLKHEMLLLLMLVFTGTLVPGPVHAVTGPDFSLLATPSSLSIIQGSMKTSTIIMTSDNGFTSNVNLTTMIVAPSGLTAILSSAIISPSATSTLTVNVANNVPSGNYLVIVTGTSGSLQHTALISIEVTAAPSTRPDFQISATTPVSFTSGNTATSTITLAALHGFSSSVTLSASVTPATDFAVSFSPATASYGYPSTATFSSSTPGSYTVTVAGTSGSLTHSTNIQVTVTPLGTPDFDLKTNPTSLSMNQGDKGTTTVTVTPKYGFHDDLGLSASFSASGLTATFSPSSVSGGSGSSTLTINSGGSVAPGVYIVTVQGSSGSLSHNVQVTISVTNPQSQQTSSNPQTILGLAPTMLYALLGGIAIVVIGGIGVAIRLRKPKPL